MDLWATGDPLFSLHGTRALGELLDRPSGTGSALTSAPGALKNIVQAPLLWVALAGAAAGLLLRERASALPGAVVVAGLAGFVVIGLAGLPVLSRYLLLPATMLVLFAALAVLGWTTAGPGRARWLLGGAAAGIVILAGLPADVRKLDRVRDFGARRHAVQDDLRAAVRATDDLPCAHVDAVDRRALAFVRAQREPRSGTGVLTFSSAEIPAGGTPVYSGRYWRVTASTACASS
jgi:hypothetical protein